MGKRLILITVIFALIIPQPVYGLRPIATVIKSKNPYEEPTSARIRTSPNTILSLSIGDIIHMTLLSLEGSQASMPNRIVILKVPTEKSPVLEYITIPFCDRDGRLGSGSSNTVETIKLQDIIKGKVTLRKEPMQQGDYRVKYGNVLEFPFEGRTIRATVIGAAMHNFFLISHQKTSDDMEASAGHGIIWGIGAVEDGVWDGTIKLIEEGKRELVVPIIEGSTTRVKKSPHTIAAIQSAA